jgi:hypothetical protein
MYLFLNYVLLLDISPIGRYQRVKPARRRESIKEFSSVFNRVPIISCGVRRGKELK